MFDVVESTRENQRARKRVLESEQRFRIMADSAPVLLWMAGRDALCDFFNQGWLTFTGRSMEQEQGTGWAEGVHPEDFQACMDVYLSAFVARRSFQMEYRLRRADGQYRWLFDQGVPRQTPDGDFVGYIGSCIDVTDLKAAREVLARVNEELEQRVQDRTAQLLRSNSDLEQFAYVASHDLQEPLRMISSHLRVLEERYQGRLDPDVDESIHYAVDGAARLQDLISGLLAYARLSTNPSTASPFAGQEALDDALTNLASVIEETSARIVARPLPVLSGDRTQLTQLFQNLIENAVKFRGHAPPEVHVGVERTSGEWVFSVHDNGIGFDPAHAERIFRVFQRLHSVDEYPGTGIGLSICKRIVERHGGRIWAESEAGKGTTFYFTLRAGPSKAPRAPA
jgi:PAS domain S-box-containing protein